MSPVKIKDLQVDATTVDEFVPTFPPLNTITALKTELPSYKAAVEDIDPFVDSLDWW